MGSCLVRSKQSYVPTCRITKLIGKGFFATVHMGVWDTGTKNIEIAVKRLNDNTDREYRVKFLQEAAIIGQFNHPHIIKLIGVIPEDKQLGVTCVGDICMGDKCESDRCVGDRCVGDRCVGDICVGDRCVGDGCMGDRCVGDICVGDRCVGDGCMGDRCVGDICVGD